MILWITFSIIDTFVKTFQSVQYEILISNVNERKITPYKTSELITLHPVRYKKGETTNGRHPPLAGNIQGRRDWVKVIK